MSVVNKEETVRGIPTRYVQKIDEKVEMLVKITDDLDGWDFLFEKEGMSARKKPGDKLMVRADAELAFDIQSVFELIINNQKAVLINPQIDKTRRVKEFTAHTFTQNIHFKQVWPTAARDMVNMTHWRVLSDGRIIIVSFNCEDYHADMQPDKGYVRADLTVGGYVMTPTKEGGTKITYCVCSDLRGTIPQAVSNTVLMKQPLIVTNIQRRLTEMGKGRATNKPVDAEQTYKGVYEKARSMLVYGDSSNNDRKGGASKNKKPVDYADNDEDNDNDDDRIDKMSMVSLFPLLLPVFVHFICQSQLWTLVAMVAIVPYSYKKLIVDPLTMGSVEQEKFVETPPGRLIIKIVPELERLLKFVDEKSKAEAEGAQFSLTHVVVKAIAKALRETPSLNGYMIGNRFYKARNHGIELSVCTDSSDMAAISVKDAHKKSLSVIASELQSQSKLIRSGAREPSRSQVLLEAIPQPVMFIAVSILKFFGVYQAMVSASTAGGMGKAVCRVLSIPRSERGQTFDGECMFVPQQSSMLLSDTPTCITIGDITMKTVLAEEGRARHVPALDLSISINSNAVSLAQAKQFSMTLQKYLNTPQHLAQ
jgi:hypothetical protein